MSAKAQLPRLTVRVVVSVEVDRENWDAAYGVGTSADAVRQDVRAWIGNTVTSWWTDDPDGKFISAEVK